MEPGLGYFEHLFAEIQAGGFRALACQRKSDVTGATTQVQSMVAGLGLRQFDHAPLPEPVKAKALEIIQQVITARDGSEEIADLGGALFAWSVEDIAHLLKLSWQTKPNQSR